MLLGIARYRSLVGHPRAILLMGFFFFPSRRIAKYDQSITMDRPPIGTVLGLAPTLPRPTAPRTGTGTLPAITLMETATHLNALTPFRLDHSTAPLPLPPVPLRDVKWPYTKTRTELRGSIAARLIKRASVDSVMINQRWKPNFASCRLGHKGCIACKKADKSGNTNFCTSCEVSVMQNAPAVIEIAEENETFKSG